MKFSFEKKDLIFLFLLLLFIGDTVYSYYQHSLAPIDGDIPSLVAPSDAYQQVLHDPFGFKIIQTAENCAGSNRYFVHSFIYTYFRIVPQLLQGFMTPIESVYASIALVKTITQVGLIFMLSLYIGLFFKFTRNERMLSIVLIAPLFQAVGFFEYMAFIDNCITYVLFYALPTLLLSIFLYPYYRAALTGNSGLNSLTKCLWMILPFVLTFSGPLVSPVLLLLCPSVLFYLFYTHWRTLHHLDAGDRVVKALRSIHWQLLFSFGLTTLLSVYSFYIGTHNSENSWEVISITERYRRLLEGLIKITSFSEGLMPIVLLVLFNLYLMQRSNNKNLDQLLKIFYFSILFIGAYLLFLPLGGYRSYRPYIIRRDTLQPVLWLLFFAWGISTVCLFQQVRSRNYLIYAFSIALICLTYTFADKVPGYTNACERQSMQTLSVAKEDCVELNESCTVMQWGNASTCEDTRYGAELLHLWNITPRLIHYHQKP
ncbi:MAG: hypothetical protein K0R51_1879 [Cytophagaceae bacterium]|jgi:hypothetical protein|nr:hypothetical protein [Cytophagaceae bacterium]